MVNPVRSVVDVLYGVLGAHSTWSLFEQLSPDQRALADSAGVCPRGYIYVPGGEFLHRPIFDEQGFSRGSFYGGTGAFCISQRKETVGIKTYAAAQQYCWDHNGQQGHLPHEIRWDKADALAAHSALNVYDLNRENAWEWVDAIGYEKSWYKIARGGMVSGSFMGDTFPADRVVGFMEAYFRCAVQPKE